MPLRKHMCKWQKIIINSSLMFEYKKMQEIVSVDSNTRVISTSTFEESDANMPNQVEVRVLSILVIFSKAYLQVSYVDIPVLQKLIL
jgi:hypothetical protein